MEWVDWSRLIGADYIELAWARRYGQGPLPGLNQHYFRFRTVYLSSIDYYLGGWLASCAAGGWMDGIDGWMDGRMHEWMNGWGWRSINDWPIGWLSGTGVPEGWDGCIAMKSIDVPTAAADANTNNQVDTNAAAPGTRTLPSSPPGPRLCCGQTRFCICMPPSSRCTVTVCLFGLCINV